MNRKKIFLGVSSLILLAAAVFANNRIKKNKFAVVFTVYVGTPVACKIIFTGATTSKFLTVGTDAAFINTCSTVIHSSLYATSTCTPAKRVFFCP